MTIARSATPLLLACALGGCAHEAPTRAVVDVGLAPALTPAPRAGAPAGDTAAISPAPAPLAGAIYEKLFEKNRTWTFAEDHTSEATVDRKIVRGHRTSRATCRVRDVTEASWGVRSTITCAGQAHEAGSSPIAAVWVATDDGLHTFAPGETPSAARLDRSNLVMPRTPRASRARVDDAETDFFTTYEVVAKGNAWCRELHAFAGDEGWDSVCFAHESGFSNGGYGWSGGSTHAVRFTLAE